jgi:hypothetical protein
MARIANTIQIDSIHATKEKKFIEINIFNLCRSPSHQTSLVPYHRATDIIFDLEDPFATHWFVIEWKKSKCLILFYFIKMKLRIHDIFPML